MSNMVKTVCVPVEPTEAMVRAFRDARPDTAVETEDGGWAAPAPDWFRARYAAMLAASPQGEGSSAEAHPPQPDALPGDLRETVARIVDPAGFDDRWDVPGLRHEASLDERVDESLAKADTILDLIQSERVHR